jgi:hypothetical protein
MAAIIQTWTDATINHGAKVQEKKEEQPKAKKAPAKKAGKKDSPAK